MFVFLAVFFYRTFVFVCACRKDRSHIPSNSLSEFVHWPIILTIVSLIPGLLESTTLNFEIKQIGIHVTSFRKWYFVRGIFWIGRTCLIILIRTFLYSERLFLWHLSNCQREGCLFTFSQTVEKTLKRDSIVEFKNTNQQTLPLIN